MDGAIVMKMFDADLDAMLKNVQIVAEILGLNRNMWEFV